MTRVRIHQTQIRSSMTFLVYLLALSIVTVAMAQTPSYSLQNLGSIGKCFGGQECETQPQVAVLNNGVIDLTFSGSVYATMSTSPSGLEYLWIGTCDINNNCGTKVTGTQASVPFFNGIATFSGLMTKKIGDGYSLKFTLKDSGGLDVAFLFGASFSVATGEMFKMHLSQEVGSATGGNPFSPNPTVTITDRGSNTLDDVSGTVSISVFSQPEGSSAVMYPAASKTVNVADGIAQFEGLTINEAGGPYKLLFMTNLVALDGNPFASGGFLPYIYSNEFFISIGLPAQLTFAEGTEITDSPVYAGEFFTVTPRILIQDAGGNTVVEDSTSAIQAAIYDNPSGATLGLETSLFPQAAKGVVTFTTFTLDKAGRDFRIGFTLSSFSSLTNSFSVTEILLLSGRFDVNIGPPRKLTTLTTSSSAWGGPFETQPELQLLDFGGNVLEEEFDAVVTVEMLPSLHPILVEIKSVGYSDTTKVATVTSSLSPASGTTYGAGSILDIVLSFNYEVWLTYPNAGTLPEFELIATDSSGNRVKALLDNTQDTSMVNSLTFNYVVSAGDSLTANTNLEVYSPSSDGMGLINLQGGSLLNGNGNEVSLIIPGGSTSSLSAVALRVDTTAPAAVTTTTVTTNGEYGVGEAIDFVVEMDLAVVVTGTPYIELTVSDVNSAKVKAYYSSIDDDNLKMTFQYVVQEGDSDSGPMGLNNNNILYPDSSSHIRRLSDAATTDISPTLSFSSTISIDTTAPALLTAFGVQTDAGHITSTNYPGDEIPLYVQFSKPVVVMDEGLTLKVNMGAFEYFAVYKELAVDDITLEFTFTVPAGAATTDMDIISGTEALLTSAQTHFIKRKATTPTQNADADTSAIYSSGNSLADYATIQLEGWNPTIQSVILNSAPAAPTLEPDDFALIDVTFDLPVSMTCEPVFIMQLSSDVTEREAVYVSGDGTNVIQFKYTVEFGDSVTGLQYRYTPGAFCYKSGCEQDDCTIKTMSAAPSVAASIVLPSVAVSSLSPSLGVYIDNTLNVQATMSSPRLTTIVGITSRVSTATGTFGNYASSAGKYGAGNTMHFDVQFTDDVLFKSGSTAYPALNLNMGSPSRKEAIYLDGFGTKVLSFMYNIIDGDNVASLKPEDISGLSPVICVQVDGCELENRNNGAVDYTAVAITDAAIEIDTTIPYITKIWTYQNTSTFDRIYTVGERIDIHVKWNTEIKITGRMPQLQMNVATADAVYATYNSILTESENDKSVFVLTYTVSQGDMAQNLTYVGPNLDRAFDQSTIYRDAASPTTEVSYVLPNSANPLPISREALFEYVHINTEAVASIVRTEFITAAGTYIAGDTMVFKVVFSHNVVLSGRATVKMNLGDHIVLAEYIGEDANTYSISVVPDLPSENTKTLYFKIPIAEGDFNPSLDYTDAFAFEVGLNDLGGVGTLRMASTTPTKEAEFDLPTPGTAGSLSDPYTGIVVKVDAQVPVMTDLHFIVAATDTGVYGPGDIVYLQMDFTWPVVVSGLPSLKLNVGLNGIQREAVYESGSGTSELFFKYLVQPGDISEALDYFADRSLFNSALESFLYNGGSIKGMSANPISDAIIYLNPPGGVLIGTKEITATSGVSSFLNLAIKKRGNDYMLRFSATPYGANTTLTTSQVVFVSFSNEFELAPDESQKHDLIGHSVDLQGKFAVLGSPAANLSVNTVQTVTTIADDPFLVPKYNVQLVGTRVARQPVIESFHTTAGVGETVAGSFKIYHDNHAYPTGPRSGETRSIPVNVLAGGLVAVLKEDLAHLGRITVTREPYIYCACDNAFTWTLTFHDLVVGDRPSIAFFEDDMEGNSAIGDIVRIQDAAFVRGQFKLNAFGKQTDYIQYDASVADIVTALRAIDVNTVHVLVNQEHENLSGERFWQITFDHSGFSYDIPTLTSTYTNDSLYGLTGNGAEVYHTTLQQGIHGPGGYNGGFKLEFRGNTTEFIAFNADAATVKSSLEALPIINFVNVERSGPTDLNGFTWTVELVDVNYNTPRGYERAVVENIEPMTVVNEMIGTDIDVKINTRYLFTDGNTKHSGARAGTFGRDSGAAYLYEKDGSNWYQISSLVGNDTSPNDKFGSSVSLDSRNENAHRIVVGAVGADMNGVYEVQSLSCVADSGTFKLNFRGWDSQAIPFDVNKEDLTNFIIADPNFFDSGVYTVESVEIEDWGSGATMNQNLCDSNTALITFYAPLNKFQGTAGPDSADIEILGVEATDLANSGGAVVLTATEITKGTMRVHGESSDLQQHGAAYVFVMTAAPADSDQDYVWTQEAQLFPMPNGDETGDRFGHSTSIWGDVIAVGAPGGANGRGNVYIYELRVGRWELNQKILVEATVVGDELGHVVAIEGNSLVMSAPYMSGPYTSDHGVVFIYKRMSMGQVFGLSQEIYPNRLNYPLAPGDLYGWSVALHNEYLVVGAPGKDAATTYFGRVANAADENTGQTFVFYRANDNYNFEFTQPLVPSNVRRNDRFGWAVDVKGDKIIASGVEDFKGSLNASRAIIEVKTEGAYNGVHIGNTFALKWKALNTTGDYVLKSTRPIKSSATAATMKAILEADLECGRLLVSRSKRDVFNSGYSWMITFVGQTSAVPLLVADTIHLTGTGARVDIGYVNEFPPEKRGLTHVFVKSRLVFDYHTEGDFIEEAFASPFTHQALDRCGDSIALSYGHAIVGCPNRDAFVPNKNSGTGSVFDLNLLELTYDQDEYSVTEGANLPINVVARDTALNSVTSDTLFYIETVDRNAPLTRQSYLQDLYGITKATIPVEKTAADMTRNSGIAVGRAQYYGSVHNESVWVGGVYDYRGISDYVPISQAHSFLTEDSNTTEVLWTTPDRLYEQPNENLTIAIYSPGLWPSPYGSLYSEVTIEDNGDGIGNNAFQFGKVYEDGGTAGAHTGHAISVHEGSEYMAAGTPDGTRVTASLVIGAPPDTLQCGVVVLYKKVNERFEQQEQIFSPSPTLNAKFGDAVILRSGYMDSTALLVVGEPNAMQAHVWLYDGASFAYEALLNDASITVNNYRFATKGTIGLDRNLLVIGAPGDESIFVYIREYTGGAWIWSSPTKMRSSNYDYDIISTVTYEHRQEFGASVAVSGRTIAVGSPFADYAKTGSDLVDFEENTEGVDIKGIAKGKVYMFYSSPAKEVIILDAPTQLTQGTFTIDFTAYGSTTTTAEILYTAGAGDLEAALLLLPNCNEVEVSSFAGAVASGHQYTWTITFLSEFAAPGGNVVPKWNGYGCTSCTVFSPLTADPSLQLRLGTNTEMSSISEHQSVGASDAHSGARFGSAIAIDKDQLVVGSMWAAATSTTNWDFEVGSLAGWFRTGTAFDYQPTYGDNSFLRNIYTPVDETTGIKAVPESSRLEGRYYIGTFDKYPGSADNYEVPDSAYMQGGTQGDDPQGTLSSEIFTIRGDEITFLIGGGCDRRKEFVELRVDGLSVAKHTGKCTERMVKVSFDTTLYFGRAGQIRIVDGASGIWGHINVDNFEFSWDVDGKRITSDSGKMYTTDLADTPRAGAVYAFHLTEANSYNLCPANKFDCVWSEEVRLTASDKREDMFFGSSVAVDDAMGVIIVGAPDASLTGFFKESPMPYPYLDPEGGIDDTTTVMYPVDSQSMIQFQGDPLMSALGNGGRGVWYQEKKDGLGFKAAKDLDDYSYANQKAGAIYVFTKDHAVIAANGDVDIAQHWYNTELTKIQGSDGTANDRFGSSVSIDKNTIGVGSIGNDGYQPDAGAVYMYHAGFASAAFSFDEYSALEGTHTSISITVSRTSNVYAGPLVLEYATSDLTATGVDTTKFDECMNMATNLRGPAKCGDYEQTSGNLIIPQGSNQAGFQIRIMNDLCHERFLKYVQLTLSVPGSSTLQGEAHSARLRIDDDDFLEDECWWSK